MNNERLLNAARAVAETKRPHDFGMDRLLNDDCGTPACVFGHYASRTDLQSDFEIRRYVTGKGFYIAYTRDQFDEDENHIADAGDQADWDDEAVRNHFGLDEEQQHELFSGWGCDDAKTPAEAARYIRAFVASDGNLYEVTEHDL